MYLYNNFTDIILSAVLNLAMVDIVNYSYICRQYAGVVIVVKPGTFK